MPWSNAEAIVIAALKVAFPLAVPTSELDNDLNAEVPVLQVQRVGGDDDGFRLDRALVDIDVYAVGRSTAADLADEVRTFLLTQLRGSQSTTSVIGRVSTVSAPSWRPYENTALRRVGATYEIYLHPVSS